MTAPVQVAAAIGSPLWGAPFVGLLASIAFIPVAAPELWRRRSAVIVAAWAAAAAAPLLFNLGLDSGVRVVLTVVIAQYLPFALTLFALYTTAGGVVLRGELLGRPSFNVGLLAVGALLASLMGTTGASMLLIRPLLRANAGRRRKTHVVVFFIFLVANVGGALSPLGDPPLLIGFLNGVDFFWPLTRLWPAALFCSALLLAVFYVLDRVLARKEGWSPASTGLGALRISGGMNLALVAATAILVAVAGRWKDAPSIHVFGLRFSAADALLDLGLLAIGCASLVLADGKSRAADGFEWEPLREVLELFLAIFICVEPLILMLKAGAQGPFAPLFDLLASVDGRVEAQLYFWLSGLLSSVLDSAPTYLVFFQLGGGNPAALMGQEAGKLVALSLGSVFFGAVTYIGNAPNAMILSIAKRAGAPMPSFLGFSLWAVCILGPIFVLTSLLFVG